jgi:hypothetical protein
MFSIDGTGTDQAGEIPMTEPIVFISRFRLRDGMAPDFAASFSDAVATIEAGKPRTAVFAAYLDLSGSDLRVVHVFPDGAAMTDHFAGSEERSASVVGLIRPTGYEVFGQAPAGAVAQLRREAEGAGIRLSTFPGAVGGFLRTSS